MNTRSLTAGRTRYPLDDFLEKLEDELYRGTRHDVPFCLLHARLQTFGKAEANELDHYLQSALRRPDFVGASDAGYLLCLPHTNKAGGATVALRLAQGLSNLQPVVGNASFPEDGATADALLSVAQHARLTPGAPGLGSMPAPAHLPSRGRE